MRKEFRSQESEFRRQKFGIRNSCNWRRYLFLAKARRGIRKRVLGASFLKDAKAHLRWAADSLREFRSQNSVRYCYQLTVSIFDLSRTFQKNSGVRIPEVVVSH